MSPRRDPTESGQVEESLAAKRRRDAATPLYVNEDVTGKYEGEELQAARARRPTAERLERLEAKHDDLAAIVGDMRETLGEVKGALTVLPDLVTAVKDASDRVHQREQVTFTASVDVDRATKLDVIDARRTRRRLIAKLAVAAVSGGTVLELVHWLLGRFG